MMEYEAYLSTISDNELLALHVAVHESLIYYQECLNRAGFEVHKRVEARGGTGLPDDKFICSVKDQPPSPPYAPELLRPLLEIIIVGEDLAKCYTPAYSEWVKQSHDEQWHTVELKKMAKIYGEAALRILEIARLPGKQVIKVSRRE